MLPYIAGGDFVIASRCYFSLKPGDVIVANHPIYNRIIKRIENVSINGELWLSGDNNDDSVSSEKMGWIEKNWIKGKVILAIRRH